MKITHYVSNSNREVRGWREIGYVIEGTKRRNRSKKVYFTYTPAGYEGAGRTKGKKKEITREEFDQRVMEGSLIPLEKIVNEKGNSGIFVNSKRMIYLANKEEPCFDEEKVLLGKLE